MAQLRVDSLLDLIHGRLTVPATTGDLEHHEACDRACRVNGDADSPGNDGGPDDGGPPAVCPLHPLVLTTEDGGPIGGYARTVVHVTVALNTLLGVGDDPGLLSGGVPVPADYVRHLALEKGSTWHRMLTDDTGSFVALSTKTYQPTEPLYLTVTSRDHTCVWPGCRRPSVLADLDHRVPYPEGETSSDNLQPLCGRHHQVKHAHGYGVVRNDDGSYTWSTRHGSPFRTSGSEQPASAPPESRKSDREHHHERERVTELFEAITSPLEKTFARLVAAGAER